MDKKDISLYTDISYIRSIMTRADVSYRRFMQFFIVMTCYTLANNLLLAFVHWRIYSDPFLTGDLAKGVLRNQLIECGWKILALIPVGTVVLLFRKAVKRENLGISLWLFDTIGFVVVFCGFVLPLVTVAITGSYEAAELFGVLAAALCVLLCGIVTGARSLKWAAYGYFALAAVVLTASGLLITYTDFAGSQMLSAKFITLQSYIRNFFYTVYPCVGYGILACFMGNRMRKEDRK